jgi:hypothetical protein
MTKRKKKSRQPKIKLPPRVLEFFQQTGKAGAAAARTATTPAERTEIARKAANARWHPKQARKEGAA